MTNLNYYDLVTRSDFLQIRVIEKNNKLFNFGLFGTKENLEKMDADNID